MTGMEDYLDEWVGRYFKKFNSHPTNREELAFVEGWRARNRFTQQLKKKAEPEQGE